MMWVDKYRPTSEDNYVFPIGSAGDTLRKMLVRKNPSHLLLHGEPGTGKTSYVSVFCHAHNVDPFDQFTYTGGEISTVDDIRKKILETVTTSTYSWDGFRVIHLEEFEHISKVGSNALRSIIERAKDTVFILSVNNLDRVDKAIRSRCTTVEVKLATQDFAQLIRTILKEENVEIDKAYLNSLVSNNPNDLRFIINTLEEKYGD